MKYKKIIITFLIISLFYLFLLLNGEKMQTLSIFPGIKGDLQDMIGYKKENLEKQNILIGKTLEFNPKNLDFKTDNSITKYVSPEISFTDLKYEPDDLVYLSGSFIIDTKGNQKLRKNVVQSLDKLSRDFFKKFKVKLKIVSAYRSYNYQIGIKSSGCSDLFCAKPGFSEHQSGLAFDMFETTTMQEFLAKSDLKKYFEWMNKNAYKYGFHNSYRKGKKIDGYEIEPWHWRYVGEDFAKYLWENDLTFSQYYNLLEK